MHDYLFLFTLSSTQQMHLYTESIWEKLKIVCFELIIRIDLVIALHITILCSWQRSQHKYSYKSFGRCIHCTYSHALASCQFVIGPSSSQNQWKHSIMHTYVMNIAEIMKKRKKMNNKKIARTASLKSSHMSKLSNMRNNQMFDMIR